MWNWSRITKNTRDDVVGQRESLTDRHDLQIRDLLDDPALRRAMGLDLPLTATAGAVVTIERPVTERPQRPFDRRRLLEAAAA